MTVPWGTPPPRLTDLVNAAVRLGARLTAFGLRGVVFRGLALTADTGPLGAGTVFATGLPFCGDPMLGRVIGTLRLLLFLEAGDAI